MVEFALVSNHWSPLHVLLPVYLIRFPSNLHFSLINKVFVAQLQMYSRPIASPFSCWLHKRAKEHTAEWSVVELWVVVFLTLPLLCVLPSEIPIYCVESKARKIEMLIQFQRSALYIYIYICIYMCVNTMCVRVCVRSCAWLFICWVHGCISGHGHSVVLIYMQIVSPLE